MRLRLPDSDESGAIAILTALLMVVVLAIAALGVDISTQVNERQKLHDTVDAAAHAGAYRLPDSGPTAEPDARASALKNDPTLSLPTAPVNAVAFFCVVASVSAGVPGLVNNSQIPATCNPLSKRMGSSPPYTWTGSRCNSTICSIPCNPAATPADVCNTVSVSATKPVPFSFAPAIGITQPGSTGSVTSAACKGPCGTIPLNPMDVAVVADRTPSMSSSDVTAMITGIKGMLQEMTPSQQYVALGSIHRSVTTNHSTLPCNSTDQGLTWPSTSKTLGQWMPVEFSNDYLTSGTINTSSSLIKGVDCLTNQSNTTVKTHLASPMKAAARYLLGIDANNLPVPETRTGTIRKAIIFETDGIPQETITTGGSTDLNIAGDISSTSGSTDLACNNFKTVAKNAKDNPNNILVVTVAFNVSSENCSSASGSAKLADVLAAASSPAASGANAAGNYNNYDCSTGPGRISENKDGDNFFCAASGDLLAPIFKTALGQLANGIRLMQLP